MHQLIQLSERIWYMDLDYAADRPNLGYIQGDEFSLMFDCGASPAHVSDFMGLLNVHGLPLPKMATLSHWHWDHALGMAALKERGIGFFDHHSCTLTHRYDKLEELKAICG